MAALNSDLALCVDLGLLPALVEQRLPVSDDLPPLVGGNGLAPFHMHFHVGVPDIALQTALLGFVFLLLLGMRSAEWLLRRKWGVI